MDSKEQFFNIIFNHYANIVGEKIPEQLLKGMCENIAEYYYEQYNRFYKQYSKSKKRYSTFNLKDIDHPNTTENIIEYFKKVDINQYLNYSSIVLQLTEMKVKEFEKRREDFYKMF